MDVNIVSEWSQAEFVNRMALGCDSREGKMCKKTSFVCKDYMCPIVKSAKDITEVRSNFAQQQKRVRSAH